MRADFQCGVCKELVPAFHYGGCCALCERIRCNSCMRQCPVCAAQLCPDCLGAPRADGQCSHFPVPPARPLFGDCAAPMWRPPALAATPGSEYLAPWLMHRALPLAIANSRIDDLAGLAFVAIHLLVLLLLPQLLRKRRGAGPAGGLD